MRLRIQSAKKVLALHQHILSRALEEHVRRIPDSRGREHTDLVVIEHILERVLTLNENLYRQGWFKAWLRDTEFNPNEVRNVKLTDHMQDL